VPGRQTFEDGHIPGADFLDLQGEFSDMATKLRFMMPDVAKLEQAFGRHGVGPDSRVVLYSIGSNMWATRFWWMLRSLGFAASVLDGGFDKWQAEGRPVERGPANGYPKATFKAQPAQGFFVDKSAVLKAKDDPNTVVVNALGAQFHRGQEPGRYGRPGRIPAASTCRLRRWSMPTTRRSFRPRTRESNSSSRASPKTRMSFAIAAAVFRPRSIFSSLCSLATRSCLSMTRRWASGRGMQPCRSKPADRPCCTPRDALVRRG
jgi:thiosulfate/3-mercaptopyruvate sulfurtransferase